MTSSQSNESFELPKALEEIQEALEEAQSDFENLRALAESMSDEVAEALGDEVEAQIEDLLDQIDSIDPSFAEPEERPSPFKIDGWKLLKEFKHVEAEYLADALRSFEGADSLQDLTHGLSQEQLDVLEEAISKAEATAWHAYNLMIGAV